MICWVFNKSIVLFTQYTRNVLLRKTMVTLKNTIMTTWYPHCHQQRHGHPVENSRPYHYDNVIPPLSSTETWTSITEQQTIPLWQRDNPIVINRDMDIQYRTTDHTIFVLTHTTAMQHILPNHLFRCVSPICWVICTRSIVNFRL